MMKDDMEAQGVRLRDTVTERRVVSRESETGRQREAPERVGGGAERPPGFL